MSAWFEAVIARHQPAAGGMSYLRVDVSGTALVGAHRSPGQYVRLNLPGYEEGVFAIASPPDPQGTTFDFLVKEGSPLTDALHDAKVGTTVLVSQPQGPGFPVERGYGRDVLLFATGSGISAIRSLLHVLLRDREKFRSLSLYFGVRTPDAFAYSDELDEWRAAGIRVKSTVSRPGRTGWQGLTGYVQSHIDDEPLSNAVAFLCGQPEMVSGVTQALESRGMSRSDLYLNV